MSGLDWKRSHLPMAWTIVQMYKHGPELQNVKIRHLSIHGQTHVMYGKAMHNHICKASHAHIHSYLLFGVFCTSVTVVTQDCIKVICNSKHITIMANGKGVLCYILFAPSVNHGLRLYARDHYYNGFYGCGCIYKTYSPRS